MKIGIVGDDTLDKTDGVEQYILTIGPWLASQGHEVHYLVGETKRADLPHIHSLARNIKVRFNGNRLSIPLPANRRRIRSLLRAENFDVLYVQMPYSPFLAARIVKAAEARTAIVGMFHILPNTWVAAWGTRLLRLWLWRSIRRFDAFLSVSTAAQVFARRAFRIPAKYLPLAVPLKPFATAKPFPEYRDVLTVLCHGRLVERKGARYLLAAVAWLYKDGTWPAEAQVLVTGAGPLEAELKQYVVDHELDAIVSFKGYISEEDKPRYMASADVTVYPSTAGESFGIVLLESMAAARGVVLAGDNPGYASVLHQRPDQLFHPQDTVAVARLLRRYLEDAKARRTAAAWQHEFVRQFDVPRVGEQLLGVFTEALHKRRG